MYFTDGSPEKNAKTHMFQTAIYKNSPDIQTDDRIIILENPEYDNFEYAEWVFSENFSNSAGWGSDKYFIDGVESVKYSISFGSSKIDTSFIIMDDDINEKAVKKIAVSFASSHE